ncbi:MAG TPA: 2-oxoglutarate dehydrogenase E1 component [Ktedonobacterales bacterium]|nr:2-oxoglutarate dehydrogenase E1 component [Ktedonobacterales bacterium]
MDSWDVFYGPNAGYALDLYDRYRRDPSTVDAATRAFFEQSPPPPDILALLDGAAEKSAESATRSSPSAPALSHSRFPAESATSAPSLPIEEKPAARFDSFDIARIVVAARLARGIREYGHLAARLDPLGTPPPGDPMLVAATHGLTEADLQALPASIVWQDAGPEAGSCYDAINRLRAMYCGSLGYDFDHVQDFDERAWLRDAVESGAYAPTLSSNDQRDLLSRLTEVEEFEHFLHTTFQGQKRFSIEGCDMLVPMLDETIHEAAANGTREVLIGMAHRGRLNVLAHILGKPYVKIFSEFHSAPNKELVPSEGSTGINYGWTGDVKYHLGGRNIVRESALTQVQVTMAHNPSHLEFVNPVVEGFTRAAQDDRQAPGAPSQDVRRALALTIHGDAAFPGEGVVAETLNLSRLSGYFTGGTIHIIANNQIGFTTGPREGRSTLYAGDLAKGFEIPIIHVNADDPEACLTAVRIASAYQQRFAKDFLVDLIGYRRWGHNEGDEPAFTQPVLYAAIATHPTVRTLYARRLETAGVVTAEDAEAMRREVQAHLKQAQEALFHHDDVESLPPLEDAPDLTTLDTRVPAQTLRALNDALLTRPDGFAANPKLDRLLQRRRERIEADGGIEWAHAESLAFASILADGTPIRMSGQDTERGTFSQRHLILHDLTTGAGYTPLQALPQARAAFAVYNSPLSEAAVLAFEYGYSVHAPGALVLWEAQFGDFANAGQVVIDQFIVAARAKWRLHPALVLLLPHGYEGQGPEHSSGRVERYLQLAGEDNLRVANCTTAAQYFHLLRIQAATLKTAPRPLVIMTPKSLLRHPLAASSLGDLAEGGFASVLDDAHAANHRDRVKRLILCSGKVAIDLAAVAKDHADARESIAVARVELLYPFPAIQIERVLSGYPNLRDVVWLQEEPRNMGAWSYIAPRLKPLLPSAASLRYIGRPERASTAEGLAEVHTQEQARILEEAYAGGYPVRTETREESHVG